MASPERRDGQAQGAGPVTLWDPVCGHTPEQIDEYTPYARAIEEDAIERWVKAGKPTRFDLDGNETSGPPVFTNSDYVRQEEGTLDHESGWFTCTECYIRIGMPAFRNGRRWTASPVNLHGVVGIKLPPDDLKVERDNVIDLITEPPPKGDEV